MEQTPSCKYFRLLADEYIEGELTGEEMREFEAHIAECPECRKEFEELRALKEMLAESNDDIPEGLHERIMSAVGSENKPRRSKLRILRRAAVSAACAVICLSLTLIFTLMPLWRENTGSGLPEDPITDIASCEDILNPTDTQISRDDSECMDITMVLESTASVNAEEPEQPPAGSTAAVSSAPEDALPDASVSAESTPQAEESSPEDATQIPDTQAETIAPETEVLPATEALSEEMQGTPETSADVTSTHTTSSSALKDDGDAPSAESSSAPGGDEITLALLIVSGLLAVASFIAFLISLSSVRNTSSKKNREEK